VIRISEIRQALHNAFALQALADRLNNLSPESIKTFEAMTNPSQESNDTLKELMHTYLVDHLRYEEAQSQLERKEAAMLESAEKLKNSIPGDEIQRFGDATGSGVGIIPMESHSLLFSLDSEDNTIEYVRVIPNLSWFLSRFDA
jgi:hypothetical protein